MKKILSLALAAAMALSLAACGNNGSQTSQSSNSGSASNSGNTSQQEEVNFPNGKQISLIVPYAAGGASDTVARIYASELEQSLDTSVIVSNVEGASGAIGLEQVRNADPDGYTMAYMPVESTMLSALGFTDLSTNDFKFVGRAMTIPAAVTVRADGPWDTFEDFLAYAKEHPGEVQVGNSGTGSIWHIAAASIEKECGVEFTHVPFDGAAPAVAALLGKNIQAVTVSPSEVKNNVDSGDFKVLCILGESRSSVVPEVETAQEMGYDITIQGWGGFAVPKDTPQAIVDILEEASEVAINSDSVKQTLADRGYEHAYLNGADMDAKAAEELAYYSELIPELGIA